MWLCVFHPCHVIWAQGRVWEVLSRSERFFLPSELAVAGSQLAGRETSRVATRTDDWMLERDRQTKRRMEKMSSLSSFFFHPLCLCGFLGSSQACLLVFFFKQPRMFAWLHFESHFCGEASLNFFFISLNVFYGEGGLTLLCLGNCWDSPQTIKSIHSGTSSSHPECCFLQQ